MNDPASFISYSSRMSSDEEENEYVDRKEVSIFFEENKTMITESKIYFVFGNNLFEQELPNLDIMQTESFIQNTLDQYTDDKLTKLIGFRTSYCQKTISQKEIYIDLDPIIYGRPNDSKWLFNNIRPDLVLLNFNIYFLRCNPKNKTTISTIMGNMFNNIKEITSNIKNNEGTYLTQEQFLREYLQQIDNLRPYACFPGYYTFIRYCINEKITNIDIIMKTLIGDLFKNFYCLIDLLISSNKRHDYYSRMMILYSFVLRNFQYPYNEIINFNLEEYEKIELIFLEIIFLSDIFHLTESAHIFISSKQEIKNFALPNGLCDIYGNKVNFKFSIHDNKLYLNNGSLNAIKPYRFNLINEYEVDFSRRTDINLYFKNGNMIFFNPKLKGSTDGLIINIINDGMTSTIYCKELFYFSKGYQDILVDRIVNVENEFFSSAVSCKIQSNKMKIEVNESVYDYIFHNSPYIELIGYFLLVAMEMCPNFTVFKSLTDLKTYILIKKCNIEYQIFETTQNFSKVFNDIKDPKAICSSMIIMHKLRVFQYLFYLNDFHNGNYGIKMYKNAVVDLQIFDIWPSPNFLEVEDLLCYKSQKFNERSRLLSFDENNNLSFFYQKYQVSNEYNNSGDGKDILCNHYTKFIFLTYFSIKKMIEAISYTNEKDGFKLFKLNNKDALGQFYSITCQVFTGPIRFYFQHILNNELIVKLEAENIERYVSRVNYNIGKLIETIALEHIDILGDLKPKETFQIFNCLIHDSLVSSELNNWLAYLKEKLYFEEIILIYIEPRINHSNKTIIEKFLLCKERIEPIINEKKYLVFDDAFSYDICSIYIKHKYCRNPLQLVL